MKKITAIILVTLLLISAVGISVSAAAYVKTVVSEKFESNTAFLAPGDLDADKTLGVEDFKELRSVILNDKEHKYSDVNGDGTTDICDLVRQYVNAKTEFVADGAMNLSGNSMYSSKFLSIIGTGATYRLECAYTTETDITVKINGIKDANGNDIVFTLAAGTTGINKTFKTALSKANYSGVELQVIGIGKIDSFSITRINMDNDYSVAN